MAGGDTENIDGGKGAKPTRPNLTRNLAFVAMTLGFLSVLASLGIGLASYTSSIKETEERLQTLYLAKAHLVAGYLLSNQAASDKDLLQRINSVWDTLGDRPEDEYLCIVDDEARLLLHTAHPQTVGKDVGANRLTGGTSDGPSSLKELTVSGHDYLGDYVSSAGQAQIAAFHKVPGRSWVLGVHRSKSALAEEASAGLRSLAIAYLVVCGGLLPVSLLILFLAVSSALGANQRSQEALRRREAEYRAIAEDLPALLVRFLPGGRITYVNDAYCTYLGKPREAIIGETFAPLSRHEILAKVESLTVASSTCVHINEVTEGSGVTRWQRWTHRALFDQNGHIVAYQAIGEDVTDQRQLQEQLNQSLKMEAIGRLAGGVAHDLNNMLTPIIGCAELLQDELGATHPQRELSDDIADAGRRSRDIVQQLLAFSRKQTLEYKDMAHPGNE